jgi:hypothetical protein
MPTDRLPVYTQLAGNLPVGQMGLVQRKDRKYLFHLELIRHPAAPSFPCTGEGKSVPTLGDLSSDGWFSRAHCWLVLSAP